LLVYLIVILSNKHDLNQETLFTIVQKLFKLELLYKKDIKNCYSDKSNSDKRHDPLSKWTLQKFCIFEQEEFDQTFWGILL
jgi:hypothetical protein